MTHPCLALPPPPLPPCEDPASRLMEGSANYLSDAELLALVIGRNMAAAKALDTARILLIRAGSLRQLARLSVVELSRLPGIGRSTACAITGALAMGSRLTAPEPGTRPQLEAPLAVAEYCRSAFLGKEQEEFHVLLLDAKHVLLRDQLVTIGLLDRSQVHAREVFRTAIRESCARIILAHNHPSGDPTPSSQDIACTRDLTAAGKIIGIEVLDHVIVGIPSGSRSRYWCSLREQNLMQA